MPNELHPIFEDICTTLRYPHGEKIGVDHFPDGEPEEQPMVAFVVSFELPKDWTRNEEDSSDWEARLTDMLWNKGIGNVNISFIE